MKAINDFFKRVSSWFKSIEEDPQKQVEKVLEDYDQKIENLKNALANLLFQKARLEDKQRLVQSQNLEFQRDLEDAVKLGKDDLALHLIEKLESSKTDLDFLQNQITELEDDINSAKQAKAQVEDGVMRYKERVKTLGSKMAALKARTSIKKELGEIRSSLSEEKGSVGRHLDQLNQRITQMSLELQEHTDSEGKSLNQQIQQLRAARKNQRHQEILDQIKNRVNFSSKAIVVN